MTEINRRALLGAAGVAGAGLALSSCCGEKGPDKQSGYTGAALNPGYGGGPIGESELWGDTVNRPKPRNTSGSFVPAYLCAAYVRFEATGVVILQGHVKLTAAEGQDETKQNDIARKLLMELKAPTAAPGPPLATVLYKDSNFENMSLNGKQVLVIFIDNPKDYVRFVSDDDMWDRPDGTREKFLEHVIRFTKYSSVKPGVEVMPNYNFANLKPIAMGAPFDGELAYRLDFWNVDNAGGQIQATPGDEKTHYRYSMNIYLKMGTNPRGGKTIATVLDPDTGNMGSKP
jgi:hypothetical protein